MPHIKERAKGGGIDEKGLVSYYTDQCSYMAKYVPALEGYLKKLGLEYRFHKITTREEARSVSVLFTAYALFYNGIFVSNEILSERKLGKFWENISGS